jgi:hypothetical protein
MTFSAQSRARWTALIALPLLFAGVAALQVRIDSGAQSFAQAGDELFLRSPDAIKRMSLGYDSLLADIYWTRAVQYYGARFSKKGSTYPLLWPLLDIATTLDPQMIIAYRFGAIFLSEKGTAGPGRADLAIELVNRGIAANPGEWHLNIDLGFLYYWRLKDYDSAAHAFLDGSKKPGAPAWMAVMAARVAQKGGSLDTARMIWTEIYESNKDPKIRAQAFQTLEGLKAVADEQQLDQLAGEYQRRFGRPPASPADLQSAGLMAGEPADPEGFAYVFGPDGRAALNPASPIVIPKDFANPQAAH